MKGELKKRKIFSNKKKKQRLEWDFRRREKGACMTKRLG